MVDPDAKLAEALMELRFAERRVADAETELIKARRAVEVARLGSRYKRALEGSWSRDSSWTEID
jgi:hypothetical protein